MSNEPILKEYKSMLQSLEEWFSLKLEKEHVFIHRAMDEDGQLFRLIYGTFEGQSTPSIVISFHLDVRLEEGISWFLKVRSLHPQLKLTTSYYIDDAGECHTGESAELVKMYKEEQKIIANWQKSKEDTDAYIKAKIVGRPKAKRGKPFHNLDEALMEFRRLVIPDGDSH